MKTFYKRADNTLAEVTILSNCKDSCYVALHKTNRTGEGHYFFFAEKKHLVFVPDNAIEVLNGNR